MITKTDLLECMLADALSAINYWIRDAKQIHVDHKFQGYAIVEDDDDRPDWKLLTAETIEKGIKATLDDSTIKNRYIITACALFQAGRYDNVDYDSSVIDVVVQEGLLGEYRYA